MKKTIGVILFTSCFLAFALGIPLMLVGLGGTGGDFDATPLIALFFAPVIIFGLSIFHSILLKVFLDKWRLSCYSFSLLIFAFIFATNIWHGILISSVFWAALILAFWIIKTDLECMDIELPKPVKILFVFLQSVIIYIALIMLNSQIIPPNTSESFAWFFVAVSWAEMLFSVGLAYALTFRVLSRMEILAGVLGIILGILMSSIIMLFKPPFMGGYNLTEATFILFVPNIILVMIAIEFADAILSFFKKIPIARSIAFLNEYKLQIVIVVIIYMCGFVIVKTNIGPNLVRLPGALWKEITYSFGGLKRNVQTNIGDRVWVGKDFSGGSQCYGEDVAAFDPKTGKVTKISNTAPNPEQELEEKQVSFYDSEVKHNAVCMACGCPTYNFTKFFLVNESDLVIVKTLGYRVSDNNDPSLGSLKEIDPCKLPAVSRGGCESINFGVVFDKNTKECVKSELSGCDKYFPFANIENCQSQCE